MFKNIMKKVLLEVGKTLLSTIDILCVPHLTTYADEDGEYDFFCLLMAH